MTFKDDPETDFDAYEELDKALKEFKDEDILELTADEVTAIYRIIEKEWINRDDPEAMAVADRISRFVRERNK